MGIYEDSSFGADKNNRPVLVFDVNETLLDIDALQPLFQEIFGQPNRMREWFAQLILYSQALSLSGRHAPFEAVGGGVLKMLGEIHGVTVSNDEVRALGEAVSTLPLHRDVAPALDQLASAGFRMVTLTNTSGGAVRDPLTDMGVSHHFEHRFTVAQVGRFKPSPETYQQVTDMLGIAPEECLLIAAHTWDTLGAQAMGWKAALITRGVNAPLEVENVPRPAFVEADLKALSSALISRFRYG
jgi:2-haloacid dehalogenase